jgi:hypothetical protein
MTNAVTVAMVDDDNATNTISAAAYTKVLTITSTDDQLTSANTITGGTGTADEIQHTSGSALDVITMTNITGIEKITAVGAANGFLITTVDANIASGKTLTIDTTAGDGDAYTINAVAETNGTVTITGDAGAHIITLGAGADTYSNTGSGVSTVVMTGGANTVTTGTGIDIITVGTGADIVTLGTGADTILFTATNQLVANSLTITDWNTADEIDFDVSATLDSGANMILLDDGADNADAAVTLATVTGAFVMSDLTDNTSLLVINVTAGIASSDALETALEYGGDVQLTASGALSVGDRILVAYDDTVSTYIAMVTFNNAVVDTGWAGSGTLTAVNLVKLTGIADVTGIAAEDIDFS